MGGLAVLFFIALYLVIAFKVIGKFKASRYKWLVVALVVLIPSGDAVVGRLYLKYLCAEEGGLKVYRVAEHVEGFMDATFTNGDDFWVKEHGYKYSEYAAVNGLVVRYSSQNGQIVREEKVPPKSQYQVRYVWNGDVFVRAEHRVETVGGLELLASYTGFSFHGGWAERFLAWFSDSGVANVATCDGDLSHVGIYEYEQAVTNSLKH